MTNFIRSTQVGDIKVEMYRENHHVRLKVNNVVLPEKFRNEKSAHQYSVTEIMNKINI